MSFLLVIWILGTVILLTASRRMWIENELEIRWQCIVMCVAWPIVLGWSLIDGVKLLLRKSKGRYLK